MSEIMCTKVFSDVPSLPTMFSTELGIVMQQAK